MASFGSFWDPWEVVDPFDIMRRVWSEDYPEYEPRRGVIEASPSSRESSALAAGPQAQGMAPYRRQQQQSRKSPIRMDMIEAPDSITVIAEMPGFKKDDIRVNVDENNVLEISAERREERTQQPGETVPHRELHYGWHKRLFKLPSYADPDNVQSEFTNGMLGIKFGRRAVPGHRQITIQ